MINNQNKKTNIITATQELLVKIQEINFLFPPEVVSALITALTNGKYISRKTSSTSKMWMKKFYQTTKCKLVYNLKEEKIELVEGQCFPNFNNLILLEINIELFSNSVVFNRCFEKLETPEKYGEFDYLVVTDTEGLLNYFQKLILKEWTPKVKDWVLTELPEDKFVKEIPYLSNNPKFFLSNNNYKELIKNISIFTNYESKQVKGLKDTWNFEEHCKKIRNELHQKISSFLNNQQSFEELSKVLQNNLWSISVQDLSYILNLLSDFGFDYQYILQFLEQIKKNALSATATEQDIAVIGELLGLKKEVFQYNLLTRDKVNDLFVEFYLEWNRKNLNSVNGQFIYLNSLGGYTDKDINKSLFDIFASERYKEECSYKQLILPNSVDEPLQGGRLKQFLQMLDKNHNKIFVSILDTRRDDKTGGIIISPLLKELVKCLKEPSNHFDVELIPQEKHFFENIHFLKYFFDETTLDDISFLLNYKK